MMAKPSKYMQIPYFLVHQWNKYPLVDWYWWRLVILMKIDEDRWYSWMYWWYWCSKYHKLPVKSQHQHVDNHASQHHCLTSWAGSIEKLGAEPQLWLVLRNTSSVRCCDLIAASSPKIHHLFWAIRESKHATAQIPICSDERTTLFVWKHQQQSLYILQFDWQDRQGSRGNAPNPQCPAVLIPLAKHLQQTLGSATSSATYFFILTSATYISGRIGKFCQSGGYPTCYWRFLRPGMARLHPTGPVVMPKAARSCNNDPKAAEAKLRATLRFRQRLGARRVSPGDRFGRVFGMLNLDGFGMDFGWYPLVI